MVDVCCCLCLVVHLHHALSGALDLRLHENLNHLVNGEPVVLHLDVETTTTTLPAAAAAAAAAATFSIAPTLVFSRLEAAEFFRFTH